MTSAVACDYCSSYIDSPIAMGTSAESQTLLKQFEEEQAERLLTAVAAKDRFTLAYEEMIDLYRECDEAGWDGYGAPPITLGCVTEALFFLKNLPRNLPMPEITAEPSGEISLEWYRDPYHVFALSVGGRGVITYAGLFSPGDKDHGTKPLTGMLPPTIHSLILRVYAN